MLITCVVFQMLGNICYICRQFINKNKNIRVMNLKLDIRVPATIWAAVPTNMWE